MSQEPISRARISGTEGGTLTIDRSEDGDVWINTGGKAIRFCTRIGGGQAPNVRAAIVKLMEAIESDGGETIR